MKRSGLARVAHVASLVAAVLLCFGTFLSLLPTGPDVPAALTTAASPHVAQGANGDWHPNGGSYLALATEEAEDTDKNPVNADLLIALLLVVSFGATVAWLLASGRGQGAFRFVGVDRRPSFITARENRPFLGVFQL